MAERIYGHGTRLSAAERRAKRKREGDYVPASERIFGAIKGAVAGPFILAILVGIDLDTGIRQDIPPAEVWGLFSAVGAALGALRLVKKQNELDR
jgi:hypothetical protein